MIINSADKSQLEYANYYQLRDNADRIEKSPLVRIWQVVFLYLYVISPLKLTLYKADQCADAKKLRITSNGALFSKQEN